MVHEEVRWMCCRSSFGYITQLYFRGARARAVIELHSAFDTFETSDMSEVWCTVWHFIPYLLTRSAAHIENVW